MRYTLVIDGVEFPGQEQQNNVSAATVAESFRQRVTEGHVGYLHSGDGHSGTLVHWGRVRTVGVIVTDGGS